MDEVCFYIRVGEISHSKNKSQSKNPKTKIQKHLGVIKKTATWGWTVWEVLVCNINAMVI